AGRRQRPALRDRLGRHVLRLGVRHRQPDDACDLRGQRHALLTGRPAARHRSSSVHGPWCSIGAGTHVFRLTPSIALRLASMPLAVVLAARLGADRATTLSTTDADARIRLACHATASNRDGYVRGARAARAAGLRPREVLIIKGVLYEPICPPP